ncbi:uncharacterized protein LOC119779383 isoform X1 [Cyprinodon tularosa]|uniref:uncharacterized protein LOC119779382 isoform X1 n=1 Tax=Cyprinodon tularosa TaxID=77115 RepID=UPI0018E28F5B|nr:uncharacterized protein LOC119779382 isoform X1 [Cyprinodon tularosa]XP_038134943.1 uncharacterized protein LOC119779383 isoform X1 [Cyprinodon tularosa]
MLGTLEPKQKSKWKEYVKPLVHAYNCTRNEVTGYSPYELMFGRCPRLPIDLAFGLPICEEKCPSHLQYVQNLKSRLKKSYQIASKNSARSAKRNKTRFDQRVLPSKLEVGDRVLVRNVRLRDAERPTETVPVTKPQTRQHTKKRQESSEDSAEVSPVEKQPVEILSNSESLKSVVEVESIEPESSVKEQPDVSAERVPPHPEDLPDPGSPVGETVPVPEISLNRSPNLDGINQIDDISLRRSTRHRVAPKRLQYTTLGNPLISVVQTLLHSLSDALVLTPTTSSNVHIV